MTLIRFYYKKLGVHGHTHVRVFAGKGKDKTFAKCGDLVFRNEEWDDFRNNRTTLEFKGEEENEHKNRED